jgi:hypothetical protein
MVCSCRNARAMHVAPLHCFSRADAAVTCDTSQRAPHAHFTAVCPALGPPDWSRAGVAHPLLVAEVQAFVGVPFEIWTIAKLAAEIAKVT